MWKNERREGKGGKGRGKRRELLERECKLEEGKLGERREIGNGRERKGRKGE